MDHHLEAGLVGALHRHRLQGRVEAQGEAGGARRCETGETEQRRGHPAVELLVVHQGHALAAGQGADEFAGALGPLGGEQPHAIAEPAAAEALVHIGVVHRPIGDLTGDPGMNDGRGHHLHRGEVARDEHHRLSRLGDLLQAFGVHHLHAARIVDDLVEDREFQGHPSRLGPALVGEQGDLGLIGLGEGDAQIGLDDVVGAGERAQAAKQPGAEVRHPVDREQPRQTGDQVIGQGLEPPHDMLGQGGSRLRHGLS